MKKVNCNELSNFINDLNLDEISIIETSPLALFLIQSMNEFSRTNILLEKRGDLVGQIKNCPITMNINLNNCLILQYKNGNENSLIELI